LFELKGTVSRDFLLLAFSFISFSIPLGVFQLFSKIREDIRKSRCTTGINNFGGKFATGVNNAGGKLPSVANNGNNYQAADNLK
jgi:hypothetical protein